MSEFDAYQGTRPVAEAHRFDVDALGRYRAALQDSSLMLPVPPPRALAGRRSANVARLRRTLELVGDLRAGSTTGMAADSMFDKKLVGGIARFQRRHRLSPSGQLDSLTWSGIHAALPERIEQMGRSLEQYRWLPHELSALLEQQPACASEALGNEIKFLTAHPGGVTRGDLAARQHLECDPLRSE